MCFESAVGCHRYIFCAETLADGTFDFLECPMASMLGSKGMKTTEEFVPHIKEVVVACLSLLHWELQEATRILDGALQATA